MTHLDLRATTAKQVQQLRFVEFEVWFLPRRDERALEGFYTPLQEDFYNAYLNSGAIFRPQRVYHIDSIVAAAGEHIRPYLTYLLGQVATTSTTPALQPSGLQSQGQPLAQYASPTEQVSQWFASLVVALQFTPL